MLDPVDQLTRDGQFGADQHQALQEAPVSNSLQDICQLLSLCKSFKGHILDIAQVASALFTPTKRGSPWKGGALPDEAQQAFEELQSYLCSSPVTDYPHHNCPYYLITDVRLRDDHQPSSLRLMTGSSTMSLLMPARSSPQKRTTLPHFD
jgi:hypothetical protein